MRRRAFIKTLGYGIGAASLGFRLPLANAAEYQGKLVVAVQADGGWDPTSFCDPKVNVAGEPVINHWAEREEIRTAGGIAYAPFANNARFFEKYHREMLVINGVDAQTNSHSVGVVHNWSGRNSEGFPAVGALVAEHNGRDMPIGYLNFGGYAATGGITRYTRLGDAGLLRNIASPARSRGDPNARYLSTADWAAVRSLQTDDAERLSQTSNLLAGDAKSRRLYAAAFGSAEGLRGYADAIPPAAEREQAEIFYAPSGVTYRSELRRQAQLSVLAFKTGVAVSADLWLGGFDTHAVHDPDHEWLLGNLTDGIDYLWDYAEEHGVADRMVVVVGSDFARTNHYNSQQGKDHWPIGSYVIMEKNQPWTNRSVGVTDELHFAHPVNPETLARDDARGTRVYPKHVHKALRRHLGIEASEAAALFAFPNTEDFAFFGSS